MSMVASIEAVMLEGIGMSQPAGKTLTEDQVLLIAKAVGDRRRYEILKRLGERPDALANDNAVIHLMVARLASGSGPRQGCGAPLRQREP